MKTTSILGLALAAMFGAGAQAAAISTTATLSGTAALSGTGVSATGTGNMTNIGAVTWTATASIGVTAISGPITITVTSGGTLTGTLSLPTSILTGTSSGSTASITIAGGTGTYAGSTGTITGAGTGSIGGTGAISLTFTGSGTINTSGGGTTSPIPTITAVQDAGSYTSSIAQGSIFVVKGTNLSGSGLQSAGYPLITTFNNVKITFTPTSGGAGTDCPMIYTYNQGGVNQLAAVLPSTLAAGNYNVTVTNGGTVGTPFAATVVKSKVGLITRDSSGSGLALVQNYISASQSDINAYTSQNAGLSPAKPGQTLIAYGTGFGAATGVSDTTGAPAYDFIANGHKVFAVVGGAQITPFYAGRGPGFVGLDQIDFTLPSNIQTGCVVSFQISFDGVLSAPTYLSIAPDASSSACVLAGYTTAQLSQFDQGTFIYGGGFRLEQFSITTAISGFGNVTLKSDSLGGDFTKISGFELNAAASNVTASSSTIGSCTVTTITGTGGAASSGTVTYLDAGTITATGPSGSKLSGTMTQTNGVYSYPLGYENPPSGFPLPASPATLIAGTYTISAAGGADINSFNASLTVGAPINVVGSLPTTVNRGSGVTVNFTGGNPTDVVSLTGSSSSGTAASTTTVSFTCTALASAGTITAPASITSQLPANASGSLEIGSGALVSFNAPLKAGGNIPSGFVANFGTGSAVAWQ